ncbi:MAG: endonuclease [Muribaculaceae bacterium]
MTISKRKHLMLWLSAVIALIASAQAPSGYYNSAIGKNKGDLLRALESIVGPHTTVSYSGLYNVYQTSDVTADGYIWDMYATTKYNPGPGDRCGNYSSIGDCYNREHSFPKSWFNDASPMVSDAFHVYPTDGKVNGQRSNYPYGECANGSYVSPKGNIKALGKLGKSTFSGYSGTVFEPDDQYKGDFARTYFYMAAAYNSRISSWDSPQLAGNSYPCFSTWSVDLLMKWHRQDPVSQKEINRNNAVEAYQHNRNPFIDHPELAEYIWGTRKNDGWTPGGVLDPMLTLPVDGSSEHIGITGVNVPFVHRIKVKGSDLQENLSISLSDNSSFSTSVNSITAEAAKDGTYFDVTFNPQSAGTFSVVVTIASSEVSSAITLTAESTDGIPAGEATNVTPTSFSVNWIDVDFTGMYTLHITESDMTTPLAGFPVQIDSSEESYDVKGATPSTTYYYWLTSESGRSSNVVSVTTADPELVLTFILPEGGLVLNAVPGEPSEPVEVQVFTDYITDPVTVTVTEPFELSSDKSTWTQSLTISPEGETVYLRMQACEAGEYSGTLSLHTATFEGDDVPVTGIAADIVSFFEDFEIEEAEGYLSSDFQGTACLWSRSNVGIYGRTSDKFNGSHALCTGKSGERRVAMAEDKLRGAGTLTFYAAPYGNDEEATVKITYSVDGGESWLPLADNVTITQGDLSLYSFTMNVTGSVRIAIEQTAGKRLNIDDIAISDYMGAVTSVEAIRSWDAYCSAPGTIAVESDGRTALTIYSIDAHEQWSSTPAAGTTIVHLTKGIYIVATANSSKKVIVK